jgi:hypothetical protein
LPQTGVTRISLKENELEVRLILCIEHKGPLNKMGSEPLREPHFESTNLISDGDKEENDQPDV